MKAMLLNRYGEDAAFTATDVPAPTAQAGQVVVKIAASSVNTVDTMIRGMGADLPIAPALPALLGMDFAGVVDAVGSGVDGFKPGDEVYGCAGGLGELPGALADYIAADARLIAMKPKRLSMREAAALPLVGITAYEALVRAQLKAGQKALIQGGAGGVGHVAVQLAKHIGADVYATVSGDHAPKIIEGYGATPIDYRTEAVADYVQAHTSGAGFDVVFDTVGGANMANSFDAAGLNAQVSSTVSLVEIDLSVAHFKGLSLHVVFMLIPMIHGVGRAVHGEILTKLAEIADAGALTPLLDETDFSLEQAGQAYDRLTSGDAMGKVVIKH